MATQVPDHAAQLDDDLWEWLTAGEADVARLQWVLSEMPAPSVRGAAMSVTYTCQLEIVHLPGHRRRHLVAAISGTATPPWQSSADGDSRASLSSFDWYEMKALLVDPDRWLAWRAETTVCGQSGPWSRDVAGLSQWCHACAELAAHAFDAAPARARALAGTTA